MIGPIGAMAFDTVAVEDRLHVAREVDDRRHPFDRFYNFFSRSAWTVQELAREVAATIVVRLNPRGVLYLVVDDTLLHKRGKNVYGLGWFRDAVASTAKRVATASGNHWVVMGLAICIPKTDIILCLPIHEKMTDEAVDRVSEAVHAFHDA